MYDGNMTSKVRVIDMQDYEATFAFPYADSCHSFGMVYSQEVRLDIDLENATFGQFMEQVKDQSDFTFFFTMPWS